MAKQAPAQNGHIDYGKLCFCILVLTYCGLVWWGVISGISALVEMMSKNWF